MSKIVNKKPPTSATGRCNSIYTTMFLLLFCCIAGALAAACRPNGNLVATCVNEKCEVVGQTEICTECKAEEAPRNGVCADLSSDTAVCAEKAGGKCTKCAGASFMYKGGCYQTTQQPGQTMCADASDGKCTRAADGGGFFVPDAGTSETKDSVVSCGDSAGVQLDVNTYKGVQNCETCNAPSAGAGPEKVAVCTKCKDGFFGATCAACHDDGCATCLDGEANHCTRCKTGKYLTATGTCVETCTEGTHFSTETADSGKECFECGDATNGVDGCERCIAPGASQPKPTCTKCKAEKYLKIDGTCANDATGCTAKTEFGKKDSVNGNKCVKCNNVAAGGITDCAECAAIESPAKAGAPLVTCSQCNGKKVQPDKKGCIQDCPSHSTEKPQRSGICECDQGYIPDDAGTGCVQGAASQCKTPDCKTCTNPAKDNEVCTECSDGKYLTPTSQCISDCTKLSNYYASVNDKGKKACKGCMVANCLTCNGQGKCSVCKDGFYGESCSKCNSACRTCSGATAEDCTECPSGKALKYDTTEKKGTCVKGCTPNTGNCEKCDLMVDGTAYCSKCKEANQFPQNGVCVATGGRAITCTSQGTGVCNTCAAGSFRMDGGCYEDTKYPGKSVCAEANPADDSCKTTAHGYKLEGGTLTTCPSNCEVCSSSTVCTMCMGGYFKTSSNTCTKCDKSCATCTTAVSTCDICADGYYKSSDKCIACDKGDASITGVRNCVDCAPPASKTGPVLCYLMKGDVIDPGKKSSLSGGAIAGIIIAVILVVGGLAGFLCWWFICRGKA
ncbi:Variant-specific surface protein [Giardia duodenalis]|uniref:Variant-specific surface protein n=2 Tax=Giardia intestinalis TaxID=5741 RepID=V6TPA1_GIAIN|nr:Variant-specific surface protein [Giardia intestinalis]